ncbi:hypothetical protein EDD21DRAFT_362174 [Dissophora ornata]|nr:hypothetical protein EDD21DRAFT_362174 [Dissophora ornata]
MSATLYLNWALNIEPKKEHVSFVNFVRKFDFTNRDVAHKAYLSLIESQHIRQCRRKRLLEAYNSFRARNEEGFWAERALLVNSAIAAKKSAVMIQEAGLQEADSGLQRYPCDLNSNVTHLNIEAETEVEVTSEIDEIITVGSQSKIPAGCEQNECPAEVDVTDEELARAKLTPFYDLILYVFKKVIIPLSCSRYALIPSTKILKLSIFIHRHEVRWWLFLFLHSIFLP